MIKEQKKINLLRLKSDYSEALNNVDYRILQQYINSGKSVMSDDLVIYMELIEMVRSMYSKYETKNFIVTTLMGKPYELSRLRATRLYYDSLCFFYSDNEVKQKTWENIYAEHLDKLAYYAIEKDDIETARRCFIDAAKMRGVGREEKAELPVEMFNRPVVIYTIDPEKAGIEPASRRELAHFIDNLPEISERERVRIKKDAGVIETTLFEDIIDNATSNTPKS